MKPMNDKIFLDTNIIIYAHTDAEPEKQKIAQKVITEKLTIISTQVLQETANTLVKKFKQTWTDVTKVVKEAALNNFLNTNTDQTILAACNIAGKCQYSFYDSLIISSALESGCSTLYTEDMHDGHIIDDRLKIMNPFNKL